MEMNDTLRTILDTTDSSYAVIGLDYSVHFENMTKVKNLPESMCYIKGKHCYEALGRSEPCEDCVFSASLKSKKVEKKCYAVVTGGVVEAVANPIFNDNGELDHVVMRFQIVTDRVEEEEKMAKLNKSLEKYSKLVELAIHESDIYTWEFNPITKTFLHLGEALMKRYGLPPDIVLTEDSFREMLHPDDRQVLFDAIWLLYNTGKSQDVDARVKVKTGNVSHYQWFRYRGIVIDDDGQKVLTGTALCIDNIVRERELLNTLIDDFEKKSRLSFENLSNMSHEIRNPINSIVGFATLLADSDDKEERKEYAKIIQNSSDILLTLVNDILDISKIEAGKISYTPKTMDFALFFDEFTTSLRQTLANPNIEFVVYNLFKKCIVEVDKSRISQVITNFVTNAFKYTEKGMVTAGYEYNKGGLKIYVSDTGIGIPKERQAEIFTRFGKVDTYAQGNGLGLSIVKALIEGVGGKVGFESQEGVGSTFWAFIPVTAQVE